MGSQTPVGYSVYYKAYGKGAEQIRNAILVSPRNVRATLPAMVEATASF